MYNCLRCGEEVDLSKINYDNLFEIIVCEKCGNRMTLEYDDSYDEETGEELEWFWLENEVT